VKVFNRQINVLLTGPRGALIDLSKTGKDLNIGFTVERNLDVESSTAEITLFNLSEETRKKLTEQKGWTLEIAAGYGQNPHPFFLDTNSADFEQGTNVIFKGDVRQIRHRREPPLLATDIEADDGGEAATKFVTRHFPKRTTVGTVFKWLQEQSGLGAGNVTRITQIKTDNGLPDRLENGTTVRGYVMEEISDMARSRGAVVSSQNGNILILKPGEPLPGVPLTLIGPNTGLVGYPYVDSEGILTLNHRMRPDVFPGAPIELKGTSFTDGRYVVERAVYSGSLWDDDFNIEIEARPFAPTAAEAAA
jgi:hypothetical protein